MKLRERRRIAEQAGRRLEREIGRCDADLQRFAARIGGPRMPWLLGEGFLAGSAMGLLPLARTGTFAVLFDQAITIATRIPFGAWLPRATDALDGARAQAGSNVGAP